MKVLLDVLTDSPHAPGVGRTVSELAPALLDTLNATDDSLLLLGNPQNFPSISPSAPVTWITPPADIAQEAFASFLNDAIQHHQPDLFHTTRHIQNLPSQIPTVLTLHDCVPVKCAFETTPQERISYLTCVGADLKKCSRAIIISQATHDDLAKQFPLEAHKFRVVPLGVSSSRFKPTSAQKHHELAESLGFKRPMILFIGNNKRHKNLVELFRGYDRARELLHGVYLTLGGYDCAPLPRHTHLIEQLHLEELVTWIGEIPESALSAVYGAATALVMPSLEEGYCLPILEAMACGTPIACSDIPAFHEICGDTATYFDPKDPDSIAQALVTVVTDNIVRNRNRTAALERVRHQSWQAHALATVQIYHEVLG